MRDPHVRTLIASTPLGGIIPLTRCKHKHKHKHRNTDRSVAYRLLVAAILVRLRPSLCVEVRPSANAYLLAFAQVAGLILVTFDRPLGSLATESVVIG